jgi:CSLREA domain-containing protein
MRAQLLLTAGLLAALPAAAAELTVTTLDDELNADGDCSLREAIEAANLDTAVDACGMGDGTDSIVFDTALSGGSVSLTLGELVIASDLRIGAIDGPFVTVLATPGARHLRVVSGEVRVQKMGFESGQAARGGSVLVEATAGLFSTTDVVFERNTATEGGGALWIDGGEVRTVSTIFDDNRASAASGGAVYVAGGRFVGMEETVFILNTATDGGALAVVGGTADLFAAEFRENLAIMRGGAVFVTDPDGAPGLRASVQATRFEANAARNGGAIWSDAPFETVLPQVTTRGRGDDPIGRSVFGGNTAFENGGAMYAAMTTATLDGLYLTENVAGFGGGAVFLGDGMTASVTRSEISYNQAGVAETDGARGGGIAVIDDGETEAATELFISESWVDRNGFWVEDTGLGGGVYAEAAAHVSVQNSTISANRAQEGAGAWATGGLTLSNSTVSSNRASGAGGGLYLDVPPGVFADGGADFTTIAQNRAGTDGGGIGCPASEGGEACFTIGNSILAQNEVANEPSDCSGRVWTTSTNLVTVEEGCIAGGTTDGSVIGGVDPLLLPLADNGGWTPTMALQDGSPAQDVLQLEPFDRFDQRLFLRPGRPDLGAYEIGGIEVGEEEGPAASATLRLDPPAPNPATGEVSLSFEQPATGPARLAVLDLLGREVRVAHEGTAPPELRRTLDVRGLAPGLYVIRLMSAGQQATQKLTIMR